MLVGLILYKHSTSLTPLISLYIAATVSTAWFWTLILDGRTEPWRASRQWVVTFAIIAVLSFLSWWRFIRQVDALASDKTRWAAAVLWGVGGPATIALTLVALIYLSDQVNGILAWPYWHMQTVAGAAILTALIETGQLAALMWLADRKGSVGRAIVGAIERRSTLLMVGCLVFIGVLQAAASVPPWGDDIKFYSDMADAFLKGQTLGSYVPRYVGSAQGTGVSYAPLPVFPLLLAASFKLVGRSLLGAALPTVVATALFPVVFYTTCRSITGSRAVAYAATILFYMFPIYQIHVIGGPEPDTVFLTLLLLAATLVSKAHQQAKPRHWIAMGAVLALVSLTRHEGTAYAAALLFSLLLVHRTKRSLWLGIAAYLTPMVTFVAAFHALTGSWWPASMGANSLSWQNAAQNLNSVRWACLPWYSQAIGVSTDTLIWLLAAAFLGIILGTLALRKRGAPLMSIPVAGMANIAIVLMMKPVLVYSLFPPDFLRHISYGITCAAVSLAYLAAVTLRFLSTRLSGLRLPLLVAVLLFTSSAIYYEAENLARPEPYFNGTGSLLWTSSFYLLTDVIERPVPMWSIDGSRTVAEAQADLKAKLADVNLNLHNRSEPYHWTSMLLAIFGLVLSVAPSRCTSGTSDLAETTVQRDS